MQLSFPNTEPVVICHVSFLPIIDDCRNYLQKNITSNYRQIWPPSWPMTFVTTRVHGAKGGYVFTGVCLFTPDGGGGREYLISIPWYFHWSHLHPIMLPLVLCPFWGWHIPQWLVLGPFLGLCPSPGWWGTLGPSRGYLSPRQGCRYPMTG